LPWFAIVIAYKYRADAVISACRAALDVSEWAQPCYQPVVIDAKWISIVANGALVAINIGPPMDRQWHYTGSPAESPLVPLIAVSVGFCWQIWSRHGVTSPFNGAMVHGRIGES
jgi:hypothetical protein